MTAAWKSIESAPKDGDEDVLLAGKRWVDVGRWDDWYAEDNPGWYSSTNHNGYTHARLEPTHWMPLPDPPAEGT